MCASKEIFPVRIQSQNGFKHCNTTKLSDSLGYDTHIVNVLVSNSVTGGQNKRYFFCELNFDQGKDCVSTACASTLKLPYKLQILMLIQIYLVAMLTETVELYLICTNPVMLITIFAKLWGRINSFNTILKVYMSPIWGWVSCLSSDWCG